MWPWVIAAFVPGLVSAADEAPAGRVIAIATGHTALVLWAAADGRLSQLDFGPVPGDDASPRAAPDRADEYHPPYGNGYVLEPALQVVHADGNTSTELAFVRCEASAVDADVTLTRIELRDRFYPFTVTLCYRAYRDEDVIEAWTEIRHEESDAVTLLRFASSAPLIKADSYWLTQLQGDYLREADLVEERLTPGIKILDSKLGVRADQMRNPSFLLSLDGPAREETGTIIGGTLAWSGSFQFAFDLDSRNRLRALGGINPLGAAYHLASGRTFTTPAMLWTFSAAGKGGMSRNLHRWARRYGIRDGDQPRPVLLNNWEATHMDFDEQKIVSLFDGAQALGAELFLLDDGWFGNQHPRNSDHAGLGDWQVNAKKLPHGLSFLADDAKRRGLGFGIWLEPEMVNPASDLYEQHPDWIIAQPHRELNLSRNQLVLDLTRPAVQGFVRQVLDDTLGSNPGITYVKWDANRYVTQPGSSYLPAGEQQHLLVDYQWALYAAMRHMAETYPGVRAMLCAGGSGRVDYGALRYFHSFWPSDNTDPAQRVFIQWGFSHFYPASTISAHVTAMGDRPLKFALDVAMSGALGIDRDVARWSADERRQVATAVTLYKERVRDLVTRGDLYRLQSPYERPQAALSYVSPDRMHAVVFIYRLGETAFPPVKLRGLDPERRYRVHEVNLPPGRNSRLALHDRVVSGATLMADGFAAPLRRSLESAVIEVVAE